jgi:hypothetical protein
LKRKFPTDLLPACRGREAIADTLAAVMNWVSGLPYP